MRWSPSPRQQAAVEFGLVNPFVGIIADPGMGKTSVTLAIIDMCIAAGDITRAIVCAPIRTAQATWPDEGDKWDDFHHLAIYDLTEWDDDNRLKILRDKRVQIITINPESLHKVILHPDFDKWGFNLLVLDEITKWKDSQTQRFKKLKKELYKFKRRIGLTGTMIPNGYMDLFGQMYCLDEGERLGKFITRYRMEHFYQVPGDSWGYLLTPGHDKIIQDKVSDILIRQILQGNVDMPELTKRTIEVNMPAEYMPKYKELDKDFLTEIHNVKVLTPTATAKAMKLRQFANGFFYHDVQVPGQKPIREAKRFHDEKIKALVQLVDELQGAPLLLGYEFQEDQARILESITDAVDLGQSKNLRMDMELFNRGRIPLAIGQVGSIAHGLNLQECCAHVAFFNPIFNLEHYIQFMMRVWRRGNPNGEVIIHTISTRHTRDSLVAKAMEAKKVTQWEFDQALVGELQ
jgi:hypothetical protein